VRVVVHLASALRSHAGGEKSLTFDLAEPVTVGDVLDAVADAHPAIGRRLRDEQGGLRRHVNVFVGSDNVRDLDDTKTPVGEGVEVSLLPAVSGG
jgi:molybdopterin converting factor small subunit